MIGGRTVGAVSCPPDTGAGAAAGGVGCDAGGSACPIDADSDNHPQAASKGQRDETRRLLIILPMVFPFVFLDMCKFFAGTSARAQ